MKIVTVFLLLLSASCAHQRGPASVEEQSLAKDSMALGNVSAVAVKSSQSNEVCFDIKLTMKGTPQQEARPSNWTIAWVDKDSRYHLLGLSQRDPASVPQGGTRVLPYGAYEEWTSTFKACTPNARIEDVQSLVLTPKSLSYKQSGGMTLQWK